MKKRKFLSTPSSGCYRSLKRKIHSFSGVGFSFGRIKGVGARKSRVSLQVLYKMFYKASNPSVKSTSRNNLVASFLMFGLIACLLALNSCTSGKKDAGSFILEKDTLTFSEGVVTYAISYPNLGDNKFKAFFPKEIKFVFKGNLSSYVINSGLGTVKIVRLLDFEKQEFISLLIDTWGTNYASKCTSEEILANETLANYAYKFTNETDTIDGLTCQKALVKNLKNNAEFEILYAPNIAINNWNSPYVGLNKLLISYPFYENGMDMLLKAKSVEPRKIDSSFFTVKGDFTWVSNSQFNDHLKSLQK